jgi:hypothetical protein
MKIIAYYLPQYYPIDENNNWWGEGFTEWTNVGKAKKLYSGHYQPKVPKDLGYYDLRIPEVRIKQAELAIEAGVDAFCYWHYWFGNNKRLLEMPFNEVLKSGKPDFPFCLGWANESWKSKVWDYSGSKKDLTLIEQLYPGKEDYINHFYSLLIAFKDRRYFRIKSRPAFVVYKPALIPDVNEFLSVWNQLAIKEGFANGIFFIAHAEKTIEIDTLLSKGFDAVNINRNGEYAHNKKLIMRILIQAIKYKIFRQPLKINYSLMIKYFIQEAEKSSNVYPTIIPNWDHTPRSGRKGSVFHNSTPELFSKHVERAFEVVKMKNVEDQIIFLKSWNEWGEGNYMEPDLKFGKKYIETLGRQKKRFNSSILSK